MNHLFLLFLLLNNFIAPLLSSAGFSIRPNTFISFGWNKWTIGSFRPENCSQRLRSKPDLTLGGMDENSQLLMNKIEAIPVTRRLSILDEFWVHRSRTDQANYVQQTIDDEPSVIFYRNYVYSTQFIEAGILRGLFTIACGLRLEGATIHIQTAGQILAYFRTLFRAKYDYSVDHLTPWNLLEWYEVLGVYPGLRPLVMKEKGQQLHDLDLVAIPKFQWEDMVLTPRMNKLMHTGYETL